MSNQQLHSFRQRLYDVLQGLGTRRVPHLDLSSGDALERALSEMEIDLAAEAADVRWRRAQDVRRALRRLEAAEYGVCESCDEPIGERRLKALPWASRCVTCQSEADAAADSRRGPERPWFESADALPGGVQ